MEIISTVGKLFQVASVFDNELYPGVVAEVGWTLASITDKLTCF